MVEIAVSRFGPRARAGALSCLCALAAACLWLAPAGAQALPADAPDPAAFQIDGGAVISVARSGGLTFIGGTFSALEARVGPGVRFNATNGRRVAPVAEVTGGSATVYTSVPDGAGGYFIGGDFTSVGGEERNNIAHILPSGNIDLGFNPNANGRVHALAVSGGAVYVGGDFNSPDDVTPSIGGQVRDYIAKLSATTGNAFSAWNPDATAGVRALAVSGGAVYAGGLFAGSNGIGGEDRNFIAKLSETSGNAFSAWDPSPNLPVHALAVSGGAVYAGGQFTSAETIGGQSRDHVAKLSATSGNAFASWNANADANVFALAVLDAAVYVGGDFNGANSIGGQNRDYIAKLSATSGNAFSAWAADANDVVMSLAASGGSVYAGGFFTSMGGEERHRMAKLSATSGTPFASFDPNVEGGGVSAVRAIGLGSSHVYAGGDFTTVNRVIRNNIAALDSTGAPTSFDANANNPVRSLAAADGVVYAGGDFTEIGGQQRRSIAKLSASSGNAFSGWNPGANPSVLALAVADGAVYVGGTFNGFNSIGGQTRNRIAKLSATSGNVFTGWNPDANGPVFAIVPVGAAIYVGGDFNSGSPTDATIGGEHRNRIAKLSATSGNAFAWDPDADGHVDSLAVAGDAVYAGGFYDNIGGQSRRNLAKLSLTDGSAVPGWDPSPNGGVQALSLTGGALYAGGFFSGTDSIGGEDRNFLAKLSAASGNVFTTWNPGASVGVNSLVASGDDVYAGGEFTTIGGRPRRGYAQFGTAP